MSSERLYFIRNYEVVSGPGPDGNDPDPSKVRESVFGGIIDVGAP